MIVKIFRALWFLSLLAAAAILLFQYASLPESVTVMEEAGEVLSLTRDTFFYLALILLCVINVLVFFIASVRPNDPDFRSWFYGLIICLNFFLIIAISFITLYNGNEDYDYQRLEVIIYASIALFVIWSLAWPMYRVYKRILPKS